MKKTILITGITGFIGGKVAEKIFNDFSLTALVRPGTSRDRFKPFENKVNLVGLNLSNSDELRSFLDNNSYDIILHIGALRGGRKFSKEEYIKTNVIATQILISNAVKNKSKFIFCSSVGVYGAIPEESPATHSTPFKEDNLYHLTKIRCEEMIHNAIQKDGLRACIVRPAITYGKGDYGFPYTLTKLVAKRLLFLQKKDIYIHLTNVNLLTEVFSQLVYNGFEIGKVWNVADKEKVRFKDLVEFINVKLGFEDDYPKNRYIDGLLFNGFTKIARLMKNELWISRFELISNDWHFNVEDTYKDFKLKEYKTIPEFKIVVEWFKM